MDPVWVRILDIQPSQFYLSQRKIDRIKKWFRPDDWTHFEPIPIKKLGGNVVFTDGHTRAFAAHMAGLQTIPCYWDTDSTLDWECYQLCVDACKKRRITCISDLRDRILSEEEYKILWNGWCDVMTEILELQRAAAKAWFFSGEKYSAADVYRLLG